MNFLSTAVPTWVSIVFILIFPFYFFVLSRTVRYSGVQNELGHSKTIKIANGILFFGLLYLVIISLVTFTGFLHTNSIPPRVFLVSTIPLILFYILFVSRTAIYKSILQSISLAALVRLHIFRLIGVFFLITYYYGALPKYFAITGGIGDMFAAVTAIFVAYALDKKKTYAIKLTYVWNIVSMLDIINVAISAVVSTRLSLTTGSQSVIEIASFPFVWIPAVAPATILFLHISIFRKLSLMRKKNKFE
jgi:hypothetical protein